jgi:high-affinity Fe2+/Pb2+ permease
MMNDWIIVIAIIATVIVVIILLVCCFYYIKRKIRNKLIDKGADIVTKTAGKYLNEKNASKINLATNITAETLKEGVIKTATKKGLEIAKEAKKNNDDSISK